MLKILSKRTVSIFLLLAAACLFLLSCKNPFMRQILDLITVSFNSKGGSSVPAQNLIRGQKVTQPADPRRGNERGEDVFEGWYSDNDTFLYEWDFDDIPAADMTLYAKWIVLPENRPEAERWSKFVALESTATLEYELLDDGVCKITVGGIAEINYPDEEIWNYWRARAAYLFTAQANTNYTFVFEAWVGEEEEERLLDVQYYYDDDEGIYKDAIHIITKTRTTYTLTTTDENGPIIKGGVRELRFQCANQTGTFYVKIISITPTD